MDISARDPAAPSIGFLSDAARASSRIPRLRVHFVRHAQSTNNVLYEVSVHQYQAERNSDPDITDRGAMQAEAVARQLSNPNAPFASRIDAIVSSPMRRALATAGRIAAAVSAREHRVDCEWHEVGGIFGQPPKGAGPSGITRTEIQEQLGSIWDMPRQVGTSGWYTFGLGGTKPKETEAGARARAIRVAARLLQEAAALDPNGDDRCVVIVSHVDFLSLVLARLLAGPSNASGGANGGAGAGAGSGRCVGADRVHISASTSTSACTADSQPQCDTPSAIYYLANCAITSLDLFSGGGVQLLMHNYCAHLHNASDPGSSLLSTTGMGLKQS